MGERLKQFNVYLGTALIRELKHHAVEAEQSLSAIVDQALRAYLAQSTAKPRKRPTERGGNASSARRPRSRATSKASRKDA